MTAKKIIIKKLTIIRGLWLRYSVYNMYNDKNCPYACYSYIFLSPIFFFFSFYFCEHYFFFCFLFFNKHHHNHSFLFFNLKLFYMILLFVILSLSRSHLQLLYHRMWARRNQKSGEPVWVHRVMNIWRRWSERIDLSTSGSKLRISERWRWRKIIGTDYVWVGKD